MRVLHSIASLKPSDGGPARSVPALAAAIARADENVEVMLCSRSEPAISVGDFPEVDIRQGRAEIEVRRFQPDIIHDHGIWLPSNRAVVSIANARKIPLVVSPRGMLEPWCLRHHRYRKLLAWYIYQQRDLKSAVMLHATAEAEARTLRKLSFRQPIIQLPNGVGLPPQAPETITDCCDRKLVFVSRLHPVKGLRLLLEAWSKCRLRNWSLDIYGPAEGGFDVELRKDIQRLQLGSSVTLNGAVSDQQKWRILHSADAAILPSYSENFGIVVAEALAASTPVITTTGTPWAGLLSHRCGWWVEANMDGLVNALRSLGRTSSGELKAMGGRGSNWIRRDFVWANIGIQMLQAYTWYLNDAASSPPGCMQC